MTVGITDKGSPTIRVLYVDDDRATARLLQRKLTGAGYEVDLAYDGEEGLSKWLAGSYDVLALDHNMPKKNGLEVIRELAAGGPLPPTIMITGLGDEMIAVEAMKLGADDYIMKDTGAYYLGLVAHRISDALARRRMLQEKRQAEEDLRTQRDLLAAIFETAPSIMMLVNEDGRVQSINRAGAAFAGRPTEEPLGLLGREVFNCTNSFEGLGCGRNAVCEDCPVLTRVMHTFRTGESIYNGEGRMTVRKDSGIVVLDFLVSTTLVMVRDKRMVLVTIVDITPVKRAEEALRESEANARALLDTPLDAICIGDLDGRILACNSTMAKRFGRLPGELLGQNVFEFMPTHVAEGQKAKRRDVIESGKQVRFEDEREGIWNDVVLNPIFDEQGRVTRIAVSAHDITAVKEAQRLTLQAERFKAVADLAGGVAHNFNNLLQIVMGGAGLALINLESGDFSDMKEHLEQVLESARFGAETVRRLNRFAESGLESTGLEAGDVFDLSDLVKQAVEMARPWWKSQPEKKGVKVFLKRKLANDCLVKGRKNDLFEVIINLIKNATEALPDGGSMGVETRREGDRAVLQVWDTGKGIPEENLGRVFTPFFTTNVEAGRGLGLATARKIIDEHGGNISVSCAPGTRTVFTVSLPLAQAVESTALVPGPAPAKPLTILAIDDMEAALKMLGEGLEKFGYTVLSAGSGEEGMEIFEENAVDLVICDLGMPGMNGWQVGKAIKDVCRRSGVPKPPFVILTGWGDQSAERERISEAGVDEVIEKPVELKTLVSVIGRL